MHGTEIEVLMSQRGRTEARLTEAEAILNPKSLLEMHNQRSGLQHAAPVTQRKHSDPNRRWRSRGVRRDAQDQRGKLRTISADEVYPGPLCYPESPAPTITPSGANALWWSLKPQQHLYAACLLACTCARERERERECTPSCNVGINIHGASGACRGYGAGVEIWQSGCVSRLRECVFVYLTAQGKGHLQFLIDKGHRLLSDAIGIHHYYCSSAIVM